jgi:hypothetical protein
MRERERERERAKYLKSFNSKYRLTLYFLIINFLIVSFFLILDFTYTNFIHTKPKIIGIPHKVFHHHLLSNENITQGGGILPSTKIYTNSLGFRDFANREIDLKNKNRIVFIGDSFTEGVLVEFKFTVAGLTYNYFANKGIEVLNAGVSSYSPSIYYNKIKFFIEKGLEFSHLVVFIDISDIEDEAVNYVTEEETLYVKSASNVTYTEELVLLKKSKDKIKKFLKDNFIISYKLIKFIDDRFIDPIYGGDFIAFTNPNEFIEYIVSKKYKRDKWTIDEDIRKEYNLGIQKSIQYIALLKDLLDKNNIKLTIVVYPWFTQIYHQDLNSIQVKIWKEFSEKNNNQFINLFPAFINEENKNLNIYEKILLDFIPYDVHWNQNGSKKIFENFIKNFKY